MMAELFNYGSVCQQIWFRWGVSLGLHEVHARHDQMAKLSEPFRGG